MIVLHRDNEQYIEIVLIPNSRLSQHVDSKKENVNQISIKKQSRLMELGEFLDNQELEIESYDEELVRKLVDKIVVYDEMLEVIFKSGINIELER